MLENDVATSNRNFAAQCPPPLGSGRRCWEKNSITQRPLPSSGRHCWEKSSITQRPLPSSGRRCLKMTLRHPIATSLRNVPLPWGRGDIAGKSIPSLRNVPLPWGRGDIAGKKIVLRNVPFLRQGDVAGKKKSNRNFAAQRPPPLGSGRRCWEKIQSQLRCATSPSLGVGETLLGKVFLRCATSPSLGVGGVVARKRFFKGNWGKGNVPHGLFFGE